MLYNVNVSLLALYIDKLPKTQRTQGGTTMEQREKVIARIQKVLELSRNNPSKEEAQSAALMAQKLLAQYHLSMVDIESMEKEVENIEEIFVEVGMGNKWKGRLAGIIAKNFRCKYYFHGRDCIVFYGYEMDAAVAAQTFEEMFFTGIKLANKFKRECSGDTKGVFNSYVVGFCEGLKEGLDRQCTALMIVTPKEVTESFEKMSAGWKHTKSVLTISGSSNGYNARTAGHRAGREAAGSRMIAG